MSICDISAEQVKNIAADAAKEQAEQKFGETYTLYEDHLKRISVYTALLVKLPQPILDLFRNPRVLKEVLLMSFGEIVGEIVGEIA